MTESFRTPTSSASFAVRVRSATKVERSAGPGEVREVDVRVPCFARYAAAPGRSLGALLGQEGRREHVGQPRLVLAMRPAALPDQRVEVGLGAEGPDRGRPPARPEVPAGAGPGRPGSRRDVAYRRGAAWRARPAAAATPGRTRRRCRGPAAAARPGSTGRAGYARRPRSCRRGSGSSMTRRMPSRCSTGRPNARRRRQAPPGPRPRAVRPSRRQTGTRSPPRRPPPAAIAGIVVPA